MKFGTAKAEFLACHTASTNLSRHTAVAYESDLRHFCQFVGGDSEILILTKEALRDYIRHLREQCKLKETTIKRRIACLKIFSRWATGEGFLPINPFVGLNEKIRLPKQLPKALAKPELCQLQRITTCDFRRDTFDVLSSKIGISLLIATGMRVGELVAVRTEDFDAASGNMLVRGKGNRQRVVYVLNPRLAKALWLYSSIRKECRESAPTLLATAQGGMLSSDRIRYHLRQLAKRAGIVRRVTPHMLRHTAASGWLEAGLDIRYVQKLLGHHSISTTEIYTHVTDTGLRSAMERICTSNN